MASGYEWRLGHDDSFVLYHDGKPLQTWVDISGWDWEVTDRGKLLRGQHFKSPGQAMEFVNESKGIDAPFDEEYGLRKIAETRIGDFDRRLDEMALDVQGARTSLLKVLDLFIDDPVFGEGYQYILDFLDEIEGRTKTFHERFDNLARNTERRWSEGR